MRIRAGVIIILVIAGLWASWRYGFSDQVLTSHTLVFDAPLSSATRDALKNHFQNYQAHTKTDFFQQAQELFPCIAGISTVRKHYAHEAIVIGAHVPCVCTHNGVVLTKDGQKLGKQYYRDDIVMRLPQIQVDHELQTRDELQELVAWAVKLPASVQHNALFMWNNPTDIHVLFHAYPRNPVFITTSTALTDDVCLDIQKIVALPEVTSVDARFTDMLIARQEKIKTKRRGS